MTRSWSAPAPPAPTTPASRFGCPPTTRLRGPLRVLLAGRGRLPARLKMLRGRPASVVIRPARDLRRALQALARDHAVHSVLVEGGATVHGAFIAAGLVDRVALFLAPRLIGGGVPIARGADLPLAKALRLGPLSTRTVGQDLLITADVLALDAMLRRL